MHSKRLNDIIETLKEQGELAFVPGVTEGEISDFEARKGIIFPLQFKEWLEYSDGGDLFLPAGVQLYGIKNKPLIDVDDNDRPDPHYIVIGALATGDPILCKKDSDTISIYNHEAERIESDEVYADFFAFLNDLHDILGIGD